MKEAITRMETAVDKVMGDVAAEFGKAWLNNEVDDTAISAAKNAGELVAALVNLAKVQGEIISEMSEKIDKLKKMIEGDTP